MQMPRLESHARPPLPVLMSDPPSKYTSDDVVKDSGDSASATPAPDREDKAAKRKRKRRGLLARIKRHGAFVGPGIIASVAYIDPGNWSTDLLAGSAFGYSHLFIVLLVGFFALLFQLLATRLGCVSGIDLAEHCRIALHDRPKNKMLWRWGVLYPLYAFAEIGIIFTDLAELLGSAIAINLLVPKIPLWACVILTSADVLLILLIFSSYPTKMVTRSMRIFELVIGLLVLLVLGSFVALLVKVSPIWKDVFHGYVPGPGIIRGGGLYIAVGILGATVMPHAMFIGSKVATMRRLAPAQYEDDGYESDDDDKKGATDSSRNTGPSLHLLQPFPLGSFNLTAPRLTPEERQAAAKEAIVNDDERAERPSLACVKAHLGHAVFDIAGSLLGFAILINSSILILAAAVFYYGDGKSTGGEGVSDLFDAYQLVQDYVGQGFAYIFALALLAAGQSASLTVTLSGQIVSEGFLQWKTKPWKRRLITRSIGIVPSLAVAVSVGRDGLNKLLVGSQVALSIVLPFVLGPLILLTASKTIMSLPTSPDSPPVPPPTPSPPRTLRSTLRQLNPFRHRTAPEGYVSFATIPSVLWLASMIWVLILMANVFAIADLARGDA